MKDVYNPEYATQSVNGDAYHHFDEWITPEGIPVASVNLVNGTVTKEFSPEEYSGKTANDVKEA